ncbi:NTP transferase domain-containing protein [bacterium]|nr:NTP transferase domain-containing protein [bacterium]
MKCLILAAGYATRLYPLTENFPKPLLKVKNKTIIDWLIDDIETSKKVDEYIVISNHKYYNHFYDWSKTKNINVCVIDDMTMTNEERLGAVLDIKYAIDKLNLDDDLLIIAGDNLLDFSLNSFIDYSINKATSCVMRYYEKDIDKLIKCGVVTIDDSDRVLRMTEKSLTPETHWCTPPFYYYLKEDIKLINEAIKDGCNTDAPGSFISWLCKNRTIHAMEMPGNRYDIGNLESYEKVQKIYNGIE